MKWIPTAFVFLLLMLVACDLGAEKEATPVVTQIPLLPTPTSTLPAEGTAVTEESTPSVTRGITLTLWTSTEIAPNNEVPGGPILLEQLSEFDSEHEDVSLFVELKTIADQGGTLSYLRTGRSVAPTMLPDVILLPSSQLASAAGQELIYPLDDRLSGDAIDDLYPVARDLVEVDQHIYGYPFALTDLEHLAYSGSAITRTVSADWTDLVSGPPAMLVYPAAGVSGARLTAQFYAFFGGTFVDEGGQPTLQVEPLVSALELIRVGVAQGFIDPQSGGIASPEQAWQIFQDSPARIVETTANYYLGRRAAGPDASLRVAPLPGPSGVLTPTVSAWTWAISTPDAERQALAAELLNWLISAPNVGEWCLQSHFDVWPTDSYVSFLQRQVSRARPALPGLNNTVLTALSDATTAVILGLSTPGESAAEAVVALQP
jgi:ABC-type glycerol-3-phosphate transport system substrate-binding protein